MHRKVNCDLTLGAALSQHLNVPFLGVRILPLRAEEQAVLAVAGPDDAIVTVNLRASLPHLVALPDMPEAPGALINAHLDDPIWIEEQAAAQGDHTSTGADDANNTADDSDDTLSDVNIATVLDELGLDADTDDDDGSLQQLPHQAAS
jgi:hypothetical protein